MEYAALNPPFPPDSGGKGGLSAATAIANVLKSHGFFGSIFFGFGCSAGARPGSSMPPAGMLKRF